MQPYNYCVWWVMRLYVEALTTFLRRDECDGPDQHRPSGLDQGSAQGKGSKAIFFISDIFSRGPRRHASTTTTTCPTSGTQLI